MLSQQAANACIEATSADLKSMSYEELERLAKVHESGNEVQGRELQVHGETVYVNTVISKFGFFRFRMRISVEMTLSAEGGCEWPVLPAVYFERFKSGRLFVARGTSKLVLTLLYTVSYGAIGGLVIALVALIWNLFLRGG